MTVFMRKDTKKSELRSDSQMQGKGKYKWQYLFYVGPDGMLIANNMIKIIKPCKAHFTNNINHQTVCISNIAT